MALVLTVTQAVIDAAMRERFPFGAFARVRSRIGGLACPID
jgi:hypothetical protein